MATLSHTVKPAQSKRAGKKVTTPRQLYLPALKAKTARQINGSDIYYNELEAIDTFWPLLIKAQLLPEEADSIEEYRQMVAALHAPWDEAGGHLDHHDRENYFYGFLNHIHVADGAYFYSFKKVTEIPDKPLREALTHALWLIHKMGFAKTSDSYFLQDLQSNVECGEDEDGIYKETVDTYKRKPIKLKAFKKSFEQFKNEDSELGEWLRLVDKYKGFDFRELIPFRFYSNYYQQPLTIFDTHAIAWDETDKLSEYICENMDIRWGDDGSMNMADMMTVDHEGTIKEAAGFTKDEIRTLEYEFDRMWLFDLTELKFFVPELSKD